MKSKKTFAALAVTITLAIVLGWSLSATDRAGGVADAQATAAAVTLAGQGSAQFQAVANPDEVTMEVRCFSCGSGSKSPCGQGTNCYGDRSDCQKKGCRISSSSSKCSTAGNAPPRC